MRESHRRRGHLLGHYAVSHGRRFVGHLQINFCPIHFLMCRRSLNMTIIVVSFSGIPGSNLFSDSLAGCHRFWSVFLILSLVDTIVLLKVNGTGPQEAFAWGLAAASASCLHMQVNCWSKRYEGIAFFMITLWIGREGGGRGGGFCL